MHEMVEIVARKLVENGQERILQRIFDGVTSNLILDVSDYKESHEHKLLHLVWRKFPRNTSTTEGQKTIISSSTQTTVDQNVSLHQTSANSVKSDESASNSDSGSISDHFFTSPDLAALERTSFKFPAKQQSSTQTAETTNISSPIQTTVDPNVNLFKTL